MRKINPWTKFFIADIIPEENEIGNAFWGYHIANNIGRLLNLDGTVFFRGIGTSLSKPSELYYNSVANIPIEMCEFVTAPAIQLAAQIEIPPQTGTTLFYGTSDGGALAQNIYDTDRVVQVAYNFWDFDEGEPYTNCFLSFGTSSEIMQIMAYNVLSVNGSFVVNYTVERGAIGGVMGAFYPAWGFQSYRTNRDGVSYIPPVAGESQYTINPHFADAVIDPGALRIFWGHDSPGTVYFKIFGI